MKEISIEKLQVNPMTMFDKAKSTSAPQENIVFQEIRRQRSLLRRWRNIEG